MENDNDADTIELLMLACSSIIKLLIQKANITFFVHSINLLNKMKAIYTCTYMYKYRELWFKFRFRSPFDQFLNFISLQLNWAMTFCLLWTLSVSHDLCVWRLVSGVTSNQGTHRFIQRPYCVTLQIWRNLNLNHNSRYLYMYVHVYIAFILFKRLIECTKSTVNIT
jgi:hypothetical protein